MSTLSEVVGRLLRPPFWVVRLAGSLRLFRLREVLFFVDTKDRAVALTLDDGPHPAVTPQLLETLAAHGAHATFFLIGERAQCYEDVVELIAAQGHELGNHSWKDERSAGLTPSELKESIAKTTRVLESHGSVRLFRPGHGSLGWGRVVAMANEQGYRCVLASVYPNDVRISSDAFVIKDVLERTRCGSIIVLHEGTLERVRTVNILRQVLPELGRRGYAVTTVSDLLARHSAVDRQV